MPRPPPKFMFARDLDVRPIRPNPKRIGLLGDDRADSARRVEGPHSAAEPELTSAANRDRRSEQRVTVDAEHPEERHNQRRVNQTSEVSSHRGSPLRQVLFPAGESVSGILRRRARVAMTFDTTPA